MEKKDYRLAAILYTDIAGFSKMMEKDEARTLTLLQAHNGIVEKAVAERGGTVIKTIGDAFLIDFRNTVDALQSALEIQYRLYDYNKENSDLPLLVRIGVHLGDIYFYENDALGEGINIAARLQSIAHPGCICMSGDVYSHVLNKVEFKADKLGRVSLKNITKEIAAYEIATPNVEFDPNRDTRTILRPDRDSESGVVAPSASDGSGAGQDLRRRILADIKARGRRPNAAEMLRVYGSEPGAGAVVADLAASGFLVAPDESAAGRQVEGSPAAPAQDEESEWRRYVSQRSAGRPEHWSEHRLAARLERRAARRSLRESYRGGDKWEGKLRDSKFMSAADSAEDYEGYAARVRSEARGAVPGFIGHLVPFVAVNAGLMALNAAVSPGFPWAIFPFGGWGIGLLEHLTAALRRRDRARDLARLPPLDAPRLEIFKKLQRKIDSFQLHCASTVSVSAFLAAVNLIVSPDFFWFLFPAAAMGIGLATHAASYVSQKADLERNLLDSFGLSGSWKRSLRKMPAPEAPEDFGRFQGLVEEARSLRASIAAHAGAAGGKDRKREAGAKPGASPVDADFLPTLDSYVDQVALLARRTLEVDRIIDLIPVEAIRADGLRLKEKLAAGAGEGLRREYEKSIAEMERQEASFRELQEQREVLELRLGSAVNTMKQLRIDLARLSGMNAAGDSGASAALRDRTSELNRYLQDLRAGYDELDALEAGSTVSPDKFD